VAHDMFVVWDTPRKWGVVECFWIAARSFLLLLSGRFRFLPRSSQSATLARAHRQALRLDDEVLPLGGITLIISDHRGVGTGPSWSMQLTPDGPRSPSSDASSWSTACSLRRPPHFSYVPRTELHTASFLPDEKLIDHRTSEQQTNGTNSRQSSLSRNKLGRPSSRNPL
jgi:hypothetical protein